MSEKIYRLREDMKGSLLLYVREDIPTLAFVIREDIPVRGLLLYVREDIPTQWRGLLLYAEKIYRLNKGLNERGLLLYVREDIPTQ